MAENINYSDNFIINDDKVELVNEIRRLFTRIMMQHASEEDDEKRWILDNCNNPVLLKKLHGMTILTLHVLDAVGRLEPVNSITISKDTNIPKGTVSKIIPKLILEELIIKESLPNNKKESVFHITPLGKEIFDLHQMMHEQTEYGIKEFLKKYETSELQFIIRLLADINDLGGLYKK